MEAMQPGIMEDCTEEDGSIYLSPLGNPVYSYAGFLYNQELLSKVKFIQEMDEKLEHIRQEK